MHEVCRSMCAEFAKEKPKAWSLDEMKKCYQLLLQTTEEMNSRLFVILSAQQHGWAFARKLQFLEAGTCFALSSKGVYFMTLNLGGGLNENYMKVAKEFQKRQDKKDDERELRGMSKPKPYTRPSILYLATYFWLLFGTWFFTDFDHAALDFVGLVWPIVGVFRTQGFGVRFGRQLSTRQQPIWVP